MRAWQEVSGRRWGGTGESEEFSGIIQNELASLLSNNKRRNPTWGEAGPLEYRHYEWMMSTAVWVLTSEQWTPSAIYPHQEALPGPHLAKPTSYLGRGHETMAACAHTCTTPQVVLQIPYLSPSNCRLLWVGREPHLPQAFHDRGHPLHMHMLLWMTTSSR